MTASLIAIAHIGGSLAGALVLGSFLDQIETWNYARNRKQIFEEAATKLGVVAEDLDREELRPELLQFLAERFSGESPANRISDCLGAVRTFWASLGFLLQLVALAGIAWYTCMNNLKGAVHAWWIVAIALFFGIANIILSLMCKRLTGRYPGQAGQGRKRLAQIRQNLCVAARVRSRHEEDESQSREVERERQSED
jgi:hypothetical protein